jgi:TolB-like protein
MAHPNFFAELKRRNVYKVAVAYTVSAWLVIQAASILFPTFDVPAVGMKLLVFILAAGFVVALVVAWAFEMTPEGLKRTTEVSPDEVSGLPYWSKRKFAGFLIGVTIVALGLLAFQLLRSSAPSAASRSESKSIAVLPLLNESGDPKDEYFSDGLSEELIAALAQIRELKVIGRSSSFRFKDKKEDSKTIGEKLGVATLLEGTVRKQGDRVRIVAELINAQDGIELWSRTFDRQLKDIFAVQQEIATAVASSLKTRLLGSEQRSGANSATQNSEAHNTYLLGHYYFLRRNTEDYRKAVDHFDEAIRLDPKYALAYTERSEAWTLIGDLTGQRDTAWPKAQRDAEQAVALAPDLAEAHGALGWVRSFTQWKLTEGLNELRRAKELSPSNPTANDLLTRVLTYVGNFAEAEKLARETIELDPLAFTPPFNLARILWLEGRLDEAEAAAHKAADLQPEAASTHRYPVFIAIQRGDAQSALREAQLEPDDTYRRFELALAYVALKDQPAADAALAELIATSRNIAAFQIAEVYATRDETDKALEWLQISFDTHDTGLLSLKVDPLLRGLRDDPRYDALVAKMNFPASP